ncbi:MULTISPECIES: hypothetical protein [unclassified Acinetobacter]|uniref:hypothetical protein n=1 Tax=unclassified Acinetobacter TaxID=196816 RepID=UPI0004DA6778|nr:MULTISPECIES: hypothetical protein [unclassified Acinetobacter]KEC83267.1 hypothetical protein DT74_16660 [Acinetobacter sp. ETR1]WEE41488.1 hypothetical protein PYV58_10080 [Acinetobacter sp. TAC-1]
MNTKPHSINPIVTHRVQPMGFFKVALISGLLTTGAIALVIDQKATEYKPPVNVPNVTPSEYGIQALKLTSDKSGIAVIKLDSFLLKVSFDFESHNDNYGVPGSEFTAVDITNLAIDEIQDINGKEYNDFTDYNDHRMINQIIVGYIERNKLVEAV